METVNENTNVEIGKFYVVNCAKIMSARLNKIIYTPIIGVLHTDPQFGVSEKHYHVDGRFNPKTNTEYKTNNLGQTNVVVSVDRQYGDEFLGTELKKLKCKTLTTGLKISNERQPIKYESWYKSMVGKSCKGKRCPHLGTLMHERSGKLVCPLHNLVGDIKTEKIIYEGVELPKEKTFLETINAN